MLRVVGIAGAQAGAKRRQRSPIREWSRASRRRLLRTCLAIDWTVVGPVLMVTLTYPGAVDAKFIPRDGRTVQVPACGRPLKPGVPDLADQWKAFRMPDRLNGQVHVKVRPVEVMRRGPLHTKPPGCSA